MDCIARQAPLSMGFFRQECWSGLPSPAPGDLPHPGIEPASGGFFTHWAIWEALIKPWALILDEAENSCSNTEHTGVINLNFYGIWTSKLLIALSCSTLCNSMDYNPPGSSVHGIFQARILEWVAISSSRGSSWPRDESHVSCFLHWQAGPLPLALPGKTPRVVSPPPNSTAFFLAYF